MDLVPRANLDFRCSDTELQRRRSSAGVRVCLGCEQAWPIPREIKWAPDPPYDLMKINPSTSETIVAYQTFDRISGNASIPPTVFQNFSFVTEHAGTPWGLGDLVEGVRFYRDTNTGIAAVSSWNPKPEGDFGANDDLLQKSAGLISGSLYLRLINLNSWYCSLFSAILSVVFIVIDIQSNVMLSASFFSDSILIDALGNARFVFIFVWLFLLMATASLAYWEASNKWSYLTCPSKGDLISYCGFWPRCWTFLAMAAFEFFLIDKDVRDIVTMLHPFKGVQDYSAFKAEGHRAFFVGYKSRTMYRAENLLSKWRLLPQHLFTRSVTLGFKMYLIYLCFTVDEDKLLFSYTLIASVFFNVITVIWDCRSLRDIYSVRCRFYRKLVLRVSQEDAANDRHQRRADARLLGLHFQCVWDENLQRVRKATREQLRQYTGKGADCCKVCGREGATTPVTTESRCGRWCCGWGSHNKVTPHSDPLHSSDASTMSPGHDDGLRDQVGGLAQQVGKCQKDIVESIARADGATMMHEDLQQNTKQERKGITLEPLESGKKQLSPINPKGSFAGLSSQDAPKSPIPTVMEEKIS